MDGFWPEVGLVFFFFSSGRGLGVSFLTSWWRVFSLFGARWVDFFLLGPLFFFLGGSSDSRLVSIVRDFLGKFLRGGLLIIVPLIALYSTAVFFGTLIASLFLS